MRKKWLVAPAISLFVLLVLSIPVAQSAENNITILDSAGLVKMVKENGAGKVTIISVFASWCPPCQKEMPTLVKARKAYGEDDLVLIGLSTDESMRDLSQFIVDYSLNFPVYSGTGELFQALGIEAIPHLFIFNRKGELVESVVGLLPEKQFTPIITQLISEN